MITINKNQNKLIPILLDGDLSSLSFPRKRESRDWVPDPFGSTQGKQVGNDNGSSPQGRTVNRRLDVILAGENASVEIIGLALGRGDENKSLELYVTHAAPRTKSEVKVRSVLRDRATFAFRGNVKIEKGAKGADAYLRSDVLLFDEAKMGDDTPALEILEPDVKAGHAATIGKVDENMLFYLMSRGLNRNQAEEMLIEGFVEPIKNILRAQREVTTSYVIPAPTKGGSASGGKAGI